MISQIQERGWLEDSKSLYDFPNPGKRVIRELKVPV
jgi:hypothetical protein